jgi:hypothetical protein
MEHFREQTVINLLNVLVVAVIFDLCGLRNQQIEKYLLEILTGPHLIQCIHFIVIIRDALHNFFGMVVGRHNMFFEGQ